MLPSENSPEIMDKLSFRVCIFVTMYMEYTNKWIVEYELYQVTEKSLFAQKLILSKKLPANKSTGFH